MLSPCGGSRVVSQCKPKHPWFPELIVGLNDVLFARIIAEATKPADRVVVIEQISAPQGQAPVALPPVNMAIHLRAFDGAGVMAIRKK